jgi:hypothetical protein
MKTSTNIEEVVKNSKHVRINVNILERFAYDLSKTDVCHWMEKCPIDLNGLTKEQKVSFLFVFNAISFSYWGTPKWSSGYDRGTWSMINSLKTAFDKGVSILDPKYLSNLSQKDLREILIGNTEIPLFQERLNILKNLGRTISSYTNFVEEMENDALKFVDQLVSTVPSFEDYSYYGNQKITFNKRAQLLASDLGHLLGFTNLDKLTACADYILPMVLRYNGALVYSEELSEIVDNKIEVPKGSDFEVEIRANTIGAVGLISEISDASDMQVNDMLWLAGEIVPESHQYHLTRTIAY